MRELSERAYFHLCLALGRLLRSGRYSRVRLVYQNGKPQVRKYRLFYAPLLVWVGGPLVRLLDTGVRVLPQREWEEREGQLYRCSAVRRSGSMATARSSCLAWLARLWRPY